MFSPDQSKASFISPDVNVPTNWNEARLFLNEKLFEIANAVNSREITQYQDAYLDSSGVNISFLNTGQTWFTEGDATLFRYGSRTVVNITGGLLDHSSGLATQTVAHGIQTTNNTRFTRIYGIANDPGVNSINSAIPLPYVNKTVANGNIDLSIDATNVKLSYETDYSNYTEVYIVLEWVENRG